MDKEMTKAVQDRFKFVKLVKDWSLFLRTTDDAKNLNQSEIIKMAMEDILGDKVTLEDIDKSRAKVRAIPEKSSEIGEIVLAEMAAEKDEKSKK